MKNHLWILTAILLIAFGCEKTQAKDPATDPATDPTEQKDTLNNPEPIIDPVDTTSTPDPIIDPMDDPANWPEPFMAQIPDGGKFPLMAYVGMDNSLCSPERLQEGIDFGLTSMFTFTFDFDNTKKILEDAKGLDIKIIPFLGDNLSTHEGRVNAVEQLKDYPNLWGYFVKDEPSINDFPLLAEIVSDLRSLDPDHDCYINLFPQMHPFYIKDMLGTTSYQEYVDTFLDTVPMNFLSFDRYPVQQNPNPFVDSGWFGNLEICATAAEKRGLPLWTFFLLTEHFNYPIPTIEHVRVQSYCDLAYGTQHLECFTYWCPDGEEFISAPINRGGSKTVAYEVGQSMMQEINKLSWVWKGCKRVCTGYTATKGKNLPAGTTEFSELENVPSKIKSLTCSKSMVLGSILTNHGYNFLMVVNTSLTPAKYTLEADYDVFMIAKDGTLSKNIPKDVTLTPGDMQLYIWE